MAKKSFEDQLSQLQNIVHELEGGNVPLDQSLNKFETGIKLSNQLQGRLQNAKHTLAKMVNDKGQEVPYDRDKNGKDQDDDADPFAHSAK